MAKRREVAVWRLDQAARFIVGAAPAKKQRRWVTQGVIVEEVGIGFGLHADTIQELRPLDGKKTKQVNWMFKSSQLAVVDLHRSMADQSTVVHRFLASTG
jgi:hypothetical protein